MPFYNHSLEVPNSSQQYYLIFLPLVKIRDEADDLDVREAALKVKETQQIQQKLEVVKTKIDAIVQELEEQLRSTDPNDFNILLKKSESAIASIVQAHQPYVDESVDRSATTFYTPKIGEKVLIKGLGNKLATVVEAPGDDNTVLVQYGKITVRLNISSIKCLTDGSDAAPQIQSRRKVNICHSITFLANYENSAFRLLLLLRPS